MQFEMLRVWGVFEQPHIDELHTTSIYIIAKLEEKKKTFLPIPVHHNMVGFSSVVHVASTE